jgi:hypothetical protein
LIILTNAAAKEGNKTKDEMGHIEKSKLINRKNSP